MIKLSFVQGILLRSILKHTDTEIRKQYELHCHAIIPHSNAAFLQLHLCFTTVHHPQCCLADEIHAREHIIAHCIHRRKVFQIFHENTIEI